MTKQTDSLDPTPTISPEKGAKIPSVSSNPSKRAGRSYTITIPQIPSWQRNHTSMASTWRNGAIAFAFILVAVVSGIGGAWIETHNNSTGFIGASLSNQEKVVTSQGELTNEIAKTVGPSVVSVNVSITTGGSGTSAPGSGGGFGLFGFSQPEKEAAAGTGIIISSNGIIMTNRHVVPVGTTNVSITLSNGTELKDVSVIGRTSPSDSLDLAFLKVNNLQGQKLVPAAIGDSANVQVGDAVVAIGNALGQFQNTVTSGIISGYGRSVQASANTSGGSSTFGSAPSPGSTENLDDLFQTDAAINEGNSGGPLVNMNGQVIGINTAIAGNAQNIGFAIPINDAKGLIEQVLKTGKFSVPYLGVRYIPLTADVAKEYNLQVQNGAFIAPSSDPTQPSVVAGSPAANAGLQTNDVITQVEGVSINSTHSLTSLLDQFTPGSDVALTVVRGTSSQKITVTLGTAPSN